MMIKTALTALLFWAAVQAPVQAADIDLSDLDKAVPVPSRLCSGGAAEKPRKPECRRKLRPRREKRLSRKPK